MLKVKVKFLYPDSLSPLDTGNEGYDLFVHHVEYLKNGLIKVFSGIAIEPPNGYHFELLPRSSIIKRNLILANSVGLIDNTYRGEIIAVFRQVGKCLPIQKGERLVQLVARKTIHCDFIVDTDLSDTERGDGGFGSTGC